MFCCRVSTKWCIHNNVSISIQCFLTVVYHVFIRYIVSVYKLIKNPFNKTLHGIIKPASHCVIFDMQSCFLTFEHEQMRLIVKSVIFQHDDGPGLFYFTASYIYAVCPVVLPILFIGDRL